MMDSEDEDQSVASSEEEFYKPKKLSSKKKSSRREGRHAQDIEIDLPEVKRTSPSKKEKNSASKASKRKSHNEDASITLSEQEEDSEIYVELPATQHVPERRNDGSLDLYLSEEDDKADKSDSSSLRKFAEKHTKGLEGPSQGLRRSPMRQSRQR